MVHSATQNEAVTGMLTTTQKQRKRVSGVIVKSVGNRMMKAHDLRYSELNRSIGKMVS